MPQFGPPRKSLHSFTCRPGAERNELRRTARSPNPPLVGPFPSRGLLRMALGAPRSERRGRSASLFGFVGAELGGQATVVCARVVVPIADDELPGGAANVPAPGLAPLPVPSTLKLPSVRFPASRAASWAWKTQRPSIARLNLALECACAVTAPPDGAGRLPELIRENRGRDRAGRLAELIRENRGRAHKVRTRRWGEDVEQRATRPRAHLGTMPPFFPSGAAVFFGKSIGFR